MYLFHIMKVIAGSSNHKKVHLRSNKLKNRLKYKTKKNMPESIIYLSKLV